MPFFQADGDGMKVTVYRKLGDKTQKMEGEAQKLGGETQKANREALLHP